LKSPYLVIFSVVVLPCWQWAVPRESGPTLRVPPRQTHSRSDGSHRRRHMHRKTALFFPRRGVGHDIRRRYRKRKIPQPRKQPVHYRISRPDSWFVSTFSRNVSSLSYQ